MAHYSEQCAGCNVQCAMCRVLCKVCGEDQKSLYSTVQCSVCVVGTISTEQYSVVYYAVN